MKTRQYFNRPHRCFFVVTAVATAVWLAMCPTSAFATGPGVHGRVYGIDESGTLLGTVSGSQIELKNQAGDVVAQATTDPSGYFQTAIPPGIYYYKVQASGYQTEDQGRGFTLERSEGYAVVNFSLVRGTAPEPQPTPPDIVPIGTLNGHVWERTAEGELQGIAEAVIMLRKLQSRTTVRTTARGGIGQDDAYYEISLEAGRWQASVTAPGFQTLLDVQPIEISAGKAIERNFILIRETPPAPAGQGIRGVVRVVLWKEGQRQPLPDDTQIRIFSAADPSQVEGPFAPDPGGQYERPLHPGQYRVQALATGYRTATSGVKSVLSGTYTTVNLALVPEHPPTPPASDKTQLVVQVYGAYEEQRILLEGAKLIVRKPGQALAEALQGTTDANGEATFLLPIALPAAAIKSQATKPDAAIAGSVAEKYVVLARKDGYQPAGVEVDVIPGVVNRAQITLQEEHPPVTPTVPESPIELVDVSGWVVYADKQSSTGYFGVEKLKMTWTVAGPGGSPARRVETKTYETSTGANGAYKIQLPASEYSVHLHLSREFKAHADERVSVTSGMKPKFFIIERAAPELVKVQGYVITQSQHDPQQYVAVSGAQVRWQDPQAPGVARPVTGITDEGGRFELLLQEGAYNVAIEPPQGFQPASAVVRVVKGMERPQFVVRRSPPPEIPIVPPHPPVIPTPIHPHPQPQPHPLAGSFAGTWNVSFYNTATATGTPTYAERWVVTIRGNSANTADALGRTISGPLSANDRIWNARSEFQGGVIQQFRDLRLSPDGRRFEGKWGGEAFHGYAIVGVRSGLPPQEVVTPHVSKHEVVQIQGIGKRTFPVRIGRGGTVEVLINQSPGNPMQATLASHSAGLPLASQGKVDVPSKPGLIGGPSHKLQYKFTADKSGKIVFHLARPWEKEPTLTAEIDVTVID